MSPRRAEAIGAALWLLWGAYYLWGSLAIGGGGLGMAGGLIGPSFYPRTLGVLVLVLALVLLGSTARPTRQRLVPPGGAPVRPSHGRIIIAAAVLVMYTALLPLAGYLLLTPILLLSLMWLLGERRWALMAIAALVLTVAVYFVFQTLVNVILPMGDLFITTSA